MGGDWKPAARITDMVAKGDFLNRLSDSAGGLFARPVCVRQNIHPDYGIAGTTGSMRYTSPEIRQNNVDLHVHAPLKAGLWAHNWN